MSKIKHIFFLNKMLSFFAEILIAMSSAHGCTPFHFITVHLKSKLISPKYS